MNRAFGRGGAIAAAAAFAVYAMTGSRGEAAQAAAYPTKPVRIIVPTAPGGGVDILARLVGQKLSESMGQPFVVDNRGGAAGNLGTTLAAKAPADGYTLLMVPSSISISPALYAQLQYDAQKDLAPVALVASTPYFMLLHPSVPASSVKQLVALAKGRPGQLNYASAGAGTASHLAVEMFKRSAGVDFVHVPFKGVGPAMINLISGHVSLMVAGYPPAAPHIKAGRLKALAVADRTRTSLMPAVPTVAESGYPGYAVENWLGLLAPAGTPEPIIARLNGEIVAILKNPQIREQLAAQGLEPAGSTPGEFASQLAAEIAKWKRVVAETGVRAD
jgi:tripartite-type tricarboxylate transporter receptor subunit TctC